MFVRRLTAGGDLTYHVAGCRYVRGRDDVVAVTATEYQRALRARRFQRMVFDGQLVAVNVCMHCLRHLRAGRWP